MPSRRRRNTALILRLLFDLAASLRPSSAAHSSATDSAVLKSEQRIPPVC
jgi:hypothetical protein